MLIIIRNFISDLYTSMSLYFEVKKYYRADSAIVDLVALSFSVYRRTLNETLFSYVPLTALANHLPVFC